MHYFSRKSFGVNEIFIKRLKKSFFNLSMAHSKTFFAKITLLKGLRAKKNRTAILYQNYGSYVAEKVGFEPTDGVNRQTISSRSRYDHFDTSPYDGSKRSLLRNC